MFNATNWLTDSHIGRVEAGKNSKTHSRTLVSGAGNFPDQVLNSCVYSTPYEGLRPADVFLRCPVSQSTSVSEPMFNATNWLTDSHIGRVETGKIGRPVPELCIWWTISQSCLRLLRSLDPLRGVEACRRVSQVSRFHNLLVCSSQCLMQPTGWLIHISDELRLGKIVRPIPERLYLGRAIFLIRS